MYSVEFLLRVFIFFRGDIWNCTYILGGIILMKKNLLTKLSVLALVGLMTFTGCSKFPMLKKDLKAGDVYTSTVTSTQALEQYIPDYKDGKEPYKVGSTANYKAISTIGETDKDKNTSVSIKFNDYSFTLSCPDPDFSEVIAEYQQQAIEESKKINLIPEAIKGKIDLNATLFEHKVVPQLENNEFFSAYNANFLRGVGKVGFIKEGDTWEVKETFTVSTNNVLDVTYKMKCTKIDDNKIYITGVAKTSKNGTTYDGKVTIEASRDDIFVSKCIVDLTLTEPGDSSDPTHKKLYKIHDASETTKKK